jgi:hypothetical protein
MKRFAFALLTSAAALAVLPLAAQTETAVPAESDVIARWQADHTAVFDAAEVTLADLEWIARPVVVFADSPNQPQFIEQMNLLLGDLPELDIRDVIIITDTDPQGGSDPRRVLRPRGFSLVLVDKDGRVNFRKPDPWSVREITRQIDKMPLRLQEIRDRLTGGAG